MLKISSSPTTLNAPPPSVIATVVRYTLVVSTLSLTPACTIATRSGTSTEAGAPAGPAMTRP